MTEPQSIGAALDLGRIAERAADAATMLGIFQRELPALARTPIRVVACDPEPAKGRSARRRRVRLLYDVIVEWNGDERPYPMLGVLPERPGFPDAELSALGRAAAGHPAVGPFERLAFFVPELRLGVQLFPLDRALPGMIEATGTECRRLIAPFLPECDAGEQLEEARAEVLRYRPERRCTIRYRVRLGGPSGPVERVVFGKVFAHEHGAAVLRDMRQLWAAASKSRCFRVPEPLGYDAERRLLFMRESAGRDDLARWIKCLERQRPLPDGVSIDELTGWMARAAEALVDLQQSGVRPHGARTFESLLADARADVSLVRETYPALASEIGAVLDRFADRPAPGGTLVPAHGSFRHTQLLRHGDTLVFLDWDDLVGASAALDAATFVARLRHRSVTRPGGMEPLERLSQVFRQEFLARQRGFDPRELALYEGFTHADTALRMLRDPEPDEHVTSDVHRLLAEAHRLIDPGTRWATQPSDCERT
jgi:hypothetical protein